MDLKMKENNQNCVLGITKKLQYEKSRCRMQRKKIGLLDLPNELQILILKNLPYPQLLTLKKVSKHFARLIETESSILLKGASLHNTFPKPHNLKILSWLSSQGNLEATIKLSLGHLYNDGLSSGANYREQNSMKAAKYFCEMEQNDQIASPVTWIFIRPPWSTAAVCCKAHVFDYIVKIVNEGNAHPHLAYCIGKVLHLFEDDTSKKRSARQWFQRAADACLPDAMYDLWCMELKELDSKTSTEILFSTRSPGYRLSLVRRLREIAATGYKPAQIQLSRLYAGGYHGGMSLEAVSKYVRNMFSKSQATQMNKLFTVQSYLTVNMRFILVDWLIEVATMKGFSHEMLHATVKCVDRYLLLREVPRSCLQLLGISCMVICTRIMENDLLTIREAVWLTDNTYKYEEVVRMMEEIVAAFRGSIKQLTAYDFLTILFNLNIMDERAQTTANFIGEASLLHSDVGHFSPAIVASACALIANLTIKADIPWSNKAKQFTGYSQDQLALVSLTILKKCLMDDPPIDHRDVKLDAVEERYNQTRFGPIKRDQIISHRELLSHFGLSEKKELETVSVYIPNIQQSAATSSSSYSEDITSSSGVLQDDFSDMESAAACSSSTGNPITVESGHLYKEEDSSDDEMNNDTPPTLSCAYLVRTDTKTRKRIRAQTCSKPSSTSPSSYTAGKTSQKIHPKKAHVLKPLSDASQVLKIVDDKFGSLQPPPMQTHYKIYSNKENGDIKVGHEDELKSRKGGKAFSSKKLGNKTALNTKLQAKSPMRM